VRSVAGLVGAAHPGPALAVTVVSGLLTVSAGLDARVAVLVVAAVLTGQLSIGWSNDLVDRSRDLAVGRTDKPLAIGAVPVAVVRVACGAAAVATVPLSLACGVTAGLVHLGCVVSGWAYNLGAKATPLSWLPYAVAFGGLPVFVHLGRSADAPPQLWMAAAGALLGVGAHLVNVVPDLADDAATGVRGLPHRLGARTSVRVAVAALVLASVTIAVGADGLSAVVLGVGLVLVAGLAAVAMTASGRTPFRVAIAIALVGVVLLVSAR